MCKKALAIIAALILSSFAVFASEMVYIPAGDTKIGLSPSQVSWLIGQGADSVWFSNCTPQYTVEVREFYIDRHEVTNRDYAAFDPRHFYQDMEADMPVTGVTWNDAEEYARWAGKRLPTEFEWEKAGRGPFGRIFPWGDSDDFTKCYSKSIRVPGYNGLVPVDLFPTDSSPYGVTGMGGNACEWTASEYLAYPGNTGHNRKYGKNFKVIRGGSFLYQHLEAFCSNRKCGQPNLKNADIGFRCVMEVEEYIKRHGREKHLGNLSSQAKN
ncbi:MAG: SUMF1/EgtB/PvdO family nonheme iron enzyme [Candidatus Wallbacteria bacterium]|nr:SUMF1/EgtB/PvdO family nonheme iron enzyme [Candidatus Wallbacteria bacterium]